MIQRDPLARVLAVLGTVLVWLPVAFMLLTAVVGSVREGRFLCDYLLPGELFPLELVGGVLLVVAAARSRWGLKPIAWSAGAMVALLAAVAGVSALTGIGSSPAEPSRWRIYLLWGLYAGFCAALLSLGVGGIRLWRHLFQRAPQPDAP